MKQFSYQRSATVEEALAAKASTPGAKFIAGGTNLLDLMKLQIEVPSHLIDIQDLSLYDIEDTSENGLRIGALVSNTDLAAHERVKRDYGVLSRAIVAGATGQLRNKATVGGNLLQRTRCPYFYDPSQPCNKRVPGSGCPAIGGFSRQHAVIGGSDHCIATQPGDMVVALAAIDAAVEVVDKDGATRLIPVREFHRLPEATPHIDNHLQPNELITAVILPPPLGGLHCYHKVRDRASYAFALVSVAAVFREDGTGHVAFGSMAPKPWRSEAAEALLSEGAEAVIDAAFAEANPTPQNAYKLRLATRTLQFLIDDAKEA